MGPEGEDVHEGRHSLDEPDPPPCPECASLVRRLLPRGPRHGASRWDSAVDGCRVVLVVAGASFDPARRRRHRILARVEAGPALDELRAALTLTPDGEDWAWTMSGTVTLALYGEDRELLASVQVLPEGWLRTDLLPGDQRVTDPDALAGWLARQVPAGD